MSQNQMNLSQAADAGQEQQKQQRANLSPLIIRPLNPMLQTPLSFGTNAALFRTNEFQARKAKIDIAATQIGHYNYAKLELTRLHQFFEALLANVKNTLTERNLQFNRHQNYLFNIYNKSLKVIEETRTMIDNEIKSIQDTYSQITFKTEPISYDMHDDFPDQNYPIYPNLNTIGTNLHNALRYNHLWEHPDLLLYFQLNFWTYRELFNNFGFFRINDFCREMVFREIVLNPNIQTFLPETNWGHATNFFNIPLTYNDIIFDQSYGCIDDYFIVAAEKTKGTMDGYIIEISNSNYSHTIFCKRFYVNTITQRNPSYFSHSTSFGGFNKFDTSSSMSSSSLEQSPNFDEKTKLPSTEKCQFSSSSNEIAECKSQLTFSTEYLGYYLLHLLDFGPKFEIFKIELMDEFLIATEKISEGYQFLSSFEEKSTVKETMDLEPNMFVEFCINIQFLQILHFFFFIDDFHENNVAIYQGHLLVVDLWPSLITIGSLLSIDQTNRHFHSYQIKAFCELLQYSFKSIIDQDLQESIDSNKTTANDHKMNILIWLTLKAMGKFQFNDFHGFNKNFEHRHEISWLDNNCSIFQSLFSLILTNVEQDLTTKVYSTEERSEKEEKNWKSYKTFVNASKLFKEINSYFASTIGIQKGIESQQLFEYFNLSINSYTYLNNGNKPHLSKIDILASIYKVKDPEIIENPKSIFIILRYFEGTDPINRDKYYLNESKKIAQLQVGDTIVYTDSFFIYDLLITHFRNPIRTDQYQIIPPLPIDDVHSSFRLNINIQYEYLELRI